MIYVPLGATGIRADNDAVTHVKILPNPLQHTRLGIQVIDRDVEEALDLTSVQIHGNDVVAASGLEHVGHELGSNGSTALVFLILTGIREVGDDGGDTTSGGGLASVNHDQKFHKTIVNIVGSCRLQDED